MRTIVDRQQAPASFGLAVDEVLLNSSVGEHGVTVRLWIGGPAVVVGRSQRVADEVDEDAARSLGLVVVRRISGGGTVLHYEGNLNVSVVLCEGCTLGGVAATFVRIGTAIAGGLAVAFDVSIEAIGNRLQVGQAKLGGAAQARRRGAVLYHSTLMLSSCPAEQIAVLRAHHTNYNPRNVRSQASPMTSLSDVVGHSVRFDEASVAVLDGLQTLFDDRRRDEALQDNERLQASVLAEHKYKDPLWTR